jgi:hypothetical protein
MAERIEYGKFCTILSAIPLNIAITEDKSRYRVQPAEKEVEIASAIRTRDE